MYTNFVCGGCRRRVETTQKGAKHGKQKHQSRRRQTRRFRSYEQRKRLRVGADTFFDPDLDPVTVAVTVFGGDRDDRRLWRWYLYRIGEETFRQLAFIQWRENRSDGMPYNPPACFQCKLTAANPKSSYLENITITSAYFHSSKGPTPEVPIFNRDYFL